MRRQKKIKNRLNFIAYNSTNIEYIQNLFIKITSKLFEKFDLLTLNSLKFLKIPYKSHLKIEFRIERLILIFKVI